MDTEYLFELSDTSLDRNLYKIQKRVLEEKLENRILQIRQLLDERNRLLTGDFKPVKTDSGSLESQHQCEFFKINSKIPPEFQAYHSGPVYQTYLTPRIHNDSLENIPPELINNHYIFFTLNFEEFLKDYILPLSHRQNRIYIIDVRTLSDSRIQTNYSSEVIWKDELRTLIDCYNNPEFMQELSHNPSDSTFKFLKQEYLNSREELRKGIISAAQSWTEQNTKPFQWEQLQDYKTMNYSYLLIPSPIKVNF